MKTYVETKGKKPFDWNKFLTLAIEGNATDEERQDALVLSGQWVTCAVGNQCDIIPRSSLDSSPLDEELQHLGCVFFRMMDNSDYVGAKQILSDIEIRSAQLVNEINAKKEIY